MKKFHVMVGPLFTKKFENLMFIGVILTSFLILFNQMQLSSISSSFNAMSSGVVGATGGGGGGGVSSLNSSSKVDLSGVDVFQITSTAMAVASVFPELKNARDEQDIMNIMIPSGTPEYSEALGGISFDDVATSVKYLAKWYPSLKEEVKQNDPEVWGRYLKLAAAPRGISCEFCCSAGPQGITSDGELRCGCAHNIGMQALTIGLMKYTNYNDAQVLREVMKWKTAFFPKNMVTLGVQVAGQDPSQLKNLPGIVGGC